MPEENRQFLLRLGGMSRMEQALVSLMSQQEIREWVLKYSSGYQELMAYYRCAMMSVETKFNVLTEALSLRYDRNPIEAVRTRMKSPESIVEKIRRRGFPLTVESIEENIHDIAGVRVICAFPSDIYKLSEMFLRQDDITLLERKDYFENPKPNGYRSLHLVLEVDVYQRTGKYTVPLELQIRTIAMDFWATLEHTLRYKVPERVPEEISDELHLTANDISALDQRMQRIHDQVEGIEDSQAHPIVFPPR